MTATSATSRVLREHLLDLDRVDVLSAAHDHVLDPVGQEEIALVVEVAAIAGAQPAVGGKRRGGLNRAIEVPGHHVRCPQPDLPDAMGRKVLARRQIHDPKLDPLVRPAGGPQQVLAGSVRVVVGPVKVDDPAGRLGQPVEPDHLAAERAQRRPQRSRGHRGRAVDDRAERRVVALGGAGHGGQHLHHRRHEDRVGHPPALEGVEHLGPHRTR